MKKIEENFSIDFRIMRVVAASSDPVQTMQNIRAGRVSVHTLLDTLEILDAKFAMEEYEQKQAEEKARQKASQR